AGGQPAREIAAGHHADGGRPRSGDDLAQGGSAAAPALARPGRALLGRLSAVRHRGSTGPLAGEKTSEPGTGKAPAGDATGPATAGGLISSSVAIQPGSSGWMPPRGRPRSSRPAAAARPAAAGAWSGV